MRFDLRKVACWLLGAASSMTILAHASGYAEFNIRVIVVFVGLAIGLACLFTKVSESSEWLASPRQLLSWLALSVVIAAGVYYVLPIRADAFHRSGWLVISGSSERSPTSKGSEVWATVRRPDGQNVPPESLEEGWKVNDNRQAVLSVGAPTRVTWQVPYDAGWELQLLRHPWSGIAEVEWNGERRRFDLSGENSFEDIPLSGRSAQGTRGRILNLVVAASDLLVGATLVLVLLMSARRRFGRVD